MKNAINWFEIPVKNFDRAKTFYETIYGGEIMVMPAMPDMPPMKYGFLPADMMEGVGGAIVEIEGHIPSENGVLIYINGGEDLSAPLAKVEKAGGKIVMPKTAIGENGFMAMFMDTEGNKLGFHSSK